MRRPRWYRWLAVSSIAVILTTGLVIALRTSEADTPSEGSIRIVETRSTAAPDEFPDASQPTGGNRIRFPSSPPPEFATRPAISAAPSAVRPAGGILTSGYEAPASGDRSAGYPVRTAAAEEPIPPSAGLPSGAARISGQPTVAPPRNSLPPSAGAPLASPYAPPSVALPSNAALSAGPLASNPPAAAPAPGSPYGPSSGPPGRPSYSTASLPQPGTALPPSPLSNNPPAAAPREMPGAAGEFPDATRPLSPAVSRAAGGNPPGVNAATQAPPPRSLGGTTPAHVSAQPHAIAPSGGDGSGRPGEKALEGPQAPTLTIEKIAPPEIQIGKPAVFEIVVRNTGNSPAEGVEIHDVVPQGTQLISTTPEVPRSPRGDLVWSLGALAPGDEAVVRLEVMPTSEGEIGSVATVRFAAAASVRTLCTRPEMLIEVQAPRTALAGDDVPLHIRVSNPGTGVATGIVLTEVIPAGLEHEAGGELEYEVGDLQPGQSRELDLTLRAVRPGTAVNVLNGKGDGRLAQEVRTQIEVTAPALALGIEGPKLRYLERQATYVVTVANPGTAAAHQVELATYLPKGLQFVDADNHGEYDPTSHSVRWSLEQLPPREQGSVTLTALPVEPGRQLLRIETSADRGVTARKEEAILVEGSPSIVFQIRDVADPIEVNGETTYEILVANDGSKEATNVRLAVNLADGMKVLEAEGPSKFAVAGRQVQFQPLAQLAPKAEGVFRIRVSCATAGDHRCQVQLMSDDMKTPITKEEGTKVYADE